MEKLDLKQVHKRLLDIATEVNDICQKHDIPLYMIAGTMLGAIRHKGFIPWDDDMDFAVPYEHYNELIKILHDELPNNLQCITFDKSETYKIPWIKVEDTATMMLDNCLDLPREKMPGITIDIFPLVSCEKDDCKVTVQKIQKLLTIHKITCGLSPGSKYSLKNVIKRIIRLFMPLSATELNIKIMKLVDSIPAGNFYTNPVDPVYYNRYFPKKWFLPLTKFNFEDCYFYGVADYDSYLTEVYHEYMKLPPEEKRRVHCEGVFSKV